MSERVDFNKSCGVSKPVEQLRQSRAVTLVTDPSKGLDSVTRMFLPPSSQLT